MYNMCEFIINHDFLYQLQQAGIREVFEETGVSMTDHNITTLGLWEVCILIYTGI
jgi:8-oxo-dGTP pyrophosphatase MutT (NUDIX family)